MEELPVDRCAVTAWRPDVDGIDEVFHAHIVDWGYPAHAHDTWTVLIVDRGAIDYSLDSRRCATTESTVAILPPGVVHDGRPASRAHQGFWKRNLYLSPDLLSPDLVGAAVDRTVIDDPTLRRALSQLHHGLVRGEETLDGEGRLALIRDRIEAHLRPTATVDVDDTRLAHRLRLLLDEHTVAPIRLADAAAVLDRSVSHLVRSFTATFGVSPHAYVVGRRIDAARGLLLDGVPPAEVATAVGFHDQAHLTRHFKRHVATTPARYARGR
ncbi:MAG: AraC family transcriptional regulator [Actinomycetota bacterium]